MPDVAGWRELLAGSADGQATVAVLGRPGAAHLTLLAVFTAILAVVLAKILQAAQGRTVSKALAGVPGPSAKLKAGALGWHARLLTWAEQYGGVYKLSTDRGLALVITDPGAALELLTQHGDHLSKEERFCKAFSQMVGGGVAAHPGLLASPGLTPHWRAARKCLAHSFSKAELSEGVLAARDKAILLVELLASGGSGVVVDMADASSRLSLDVLGLALLGYDFQAVDLTGTSEALMLRLLRDCCREWAARQANPVRQWLWWANDSWGEGRQKYLILQDFTRELWHGISNTPFPADNQCLAAQLSRLRDPQTAGPPAPAALLSELAGLLLAGWAGLCDSLCWCLHLLATRPHCQEELHQQLQACGWVADPTRITLEQLGPATQPYLDHIVREALRLWPQDPTTGSVHGPCMAPRRATHSIHLQAVNTTVPAGTLLWVLPSGMHHSSRLWQDADKFRPERWQQQEQQQPGTNAAPAAGLADHGSTSSAPFDGFASSSDVSSAADILAAPRTAAGSQAVGKESEPRLRSSTAAFMPFGAGPRGCLGQALAQVHLKVCLAVLVSHLKLEPADGEDRSRASALGIGKSMPLIVTLRHPDLFQ